MFLIKFDGALNKRWDKRFGGTGGDSTPIDLAVDSQNNAYVTGYTPSGGQVRDPSALLGGLQNNLGGRDAFLFKFNKDGLGQYAKQFGTSSDDLARGLDLGPSQVVNVAGRTTGTFDPVKPNAGGADVFVTKRRTEDGSEIVSRQFGSPGQDGALGLAYDRSSDKVVVAGTTDGSLFGMPNAGGVDGFVAKVDYNGSDDDADGDGLSNNVEDTLGTSRTNKDTDGDGLLDPWEVDPSVPGAGFDLGGDGVADVERDVVFGRYGDGTVQQNKPDHRLPTPYYDLVEKPDPLHKDLYFEIDWQDCKQDGCPEALGIVETDPTHHAPNVKAMQALQEMFADAPVPNNSDPNPNLEEQRGINLHILVDEAIEHNPNCDQNSSSVHGKYFGTELQRAIPDVIRAKELAFRYVWSGHSAMADDAQAAQDCSDPTVHDQQEQGYGRLAIPGYDLSPFGSTNANGKDILVTLGPMWICPMKNDSFGIPTCYRGLELSKPGTNLNVPGYGKPNPGIFPATVEGKTGNYSYPLSRLMGVEEFKGTEHLWGRALAHLMGESLGIPSDAIGNDPNLPVSNSENPAHDHDGTVGPDPYTDWSSIDYAVPSGAGTSTAAEDKPDYALQNADLDGDGTTEANDNCPGVSNPGQEQAVNSVAGTACYYDDDGDGVPEPEPPIVVPHTATNNGVRTLAAQEGSTSVANAEEEGNDPFPDDTDNDGVINEEDLDDDGDGVRSATDNCDFLPNQDQADLDADGIGNACDEDSDADGLQDGLEDATGADPLDPASKTEFVGAGASCSDDVDNDKDGRTDGADTGCQDPDGDTNPDLTDTCPTQASRGALDQDQDGVGDACDSMPLPANYRPSVTTAWAWGIPEGGTKTLTAQASDPEGDALTFDWDLNNDGTFETAGRSVTFDAFGIQGPATREVVVRATDTAGNSATATSTVNVLDVPASTLTAPSEGTHLSGTVTLSADASAVAGMERVEFLVDGAVVGTDSTAPYSFDWNTINVTDGDTTLVARAVDTLGTRGSSASRSVTVDNTLPDTAITAGPDGPANNPTFSWTGSDAITSTQDLVYSYKLDSSGTWSTYSSATSVTLSDVSPGEHTFYVRAKDKAGNVDSSPAQQIFTIETTAPTLTDKIPASGATGVARDADVVVTFSEALQPATVNTSTFTLVKQGGTTPVEATVSYDGATNKATLNPAQDLDSETTYNATIRGGASGVKDLVGNALAADSSWSFTVTDYTPPTATNVFPASGTTGVPLATDVSATFSEEMDASTVSGSTITLVKQGMTTPIPATVRYDSATKKAILDPTNNLASLTTYVATVKGGSGGVKDRAGNALAADKTWTFTTADTEAPAAPTIDLIAASDTGSSSTDNLTNDSTPTLSGNAEASSTVKIKDGTTVLGTITASMPTGAWSFTPASALAEGAHQLSATATDAAGNQSPASPTLTVTVDTTAPAATPPSHALTTPTQLSASAVPVLISWPAATDVSGIDRYELRQSTDGGTTFTNVALSSQDQTNRSYTAMLAPGTTTYLFEVRAVDKAGNGSWTRGSSFKVGDYPETSGSIAYAGTGWTAGSSNNFVGGSVKFASAASNKATLTFTNAKQVGWVTTGGPARGKAKVSFYEGSTLVASVTKDTYLDPVQYRRLLYSKSGLAPTKTYKLVVEVLGTKSAASTGTRVDADSFVVIR